jgi:hypothetical protein
MWLYIADWTTNYGKWKSVFCKASSFPSCSSITWDMVGDQSPGIWLGDTVNNLRVAFQTEVAIPTACIQPNVPPGDKGPDNLMACVREYSRRTDTSITMTPVLEYSEIRNVPIGEWFQITIVLRGQFIELYQNGNLHTTTNLLGTPSLNTSIGQFAFANPFSGRMAFFRYMPFAVTVSLIQEMYAYENRQSFLKDIDPMQDDL